VYGDQPPETIEYNMLAAPHYRSGGAPNMGEALYKAIANLSH